MYTKTGGIIMRIYITVLLTFVMSYMSAEPIDGKVISVIDGNTFEILTKDKEKVTVMLFDADSPELGQAYGTEAKSYAEKSLLKKKVKVEIKGKDRWGNKLAKITLKGNVDFSEQIIKSGLAWVGLKHQKLASLKNLEDNAKSATLGMWQSDEIVSPWIFRRKQTMLQAKSR